MEIEGETDPEVVGVPVFVGVNDFVGVTVADADADPLPEGEPLTELDRVDV